MSTIRLKVITPRKVIIDREVDFVSVPTTDGEITILPDHVPLFSSLTQGEVRLSYGGEDYFLSIGSGFIEVTPEKTTLLVTSAYKAEELNEKAILKAKQEAEELLRRGPTPDQRIAAQALLRSTLVELKVLRRHRKH